MFEVTIRRRFAAAHQLRDYVGPCAQLHGHTWVVEIGVTGPQLNQIGLLLDFTDLKRFLREVIDELDHTNLNDHEYFKAHNPSSEEIARYVYHRLERGLADQADQAGGAADLSLTFVRVWESDDAAATYRPAAS